MAWEKLKHLGFSFQAIWTGNFDSDCLYRDLGPRTAIDGITYVASQGPSGRLRSKEAIVNDAFLPWSVWPMLMRDISVVNLRMMWAVATEKKGVCLLSKSFDRR